MESLKYSVRLLLLHAFTLDSVELFPSSFGPSLAARPLHGLRKRLEEGGASLDIGQNLLRRKLRKFWGCTPVGPATSTAAIIRMDVGFSLLFPKQSQ